MSTAHRSRQSRKESEEKVSRYLQNLEKSARSFESSGTEDRILHSIIEVEESTEEEEREERLGTVRPLRYHRIARPAPDSGEEESDLSSGTSREMGEESIDGWSL